MMESRMRGGPFVTPGGGRYYGRGNFQAGRGFMSVRFSDIVGGGGRSTVRGDGKEPGSP